MKVICKRCGPTLSHLQCKGFCSACYKAEKTGKERLCERLQKRNYLEDGNGIITDGRGSRWELDPPDFERVKHIFWQDNGNGYARNPKYGYMHRMICPNEWAMVDHIDRNPFNCHQKNLRNGTNINPLNAPKREATKCMYRGVERNHKRWCARITVEGIRHYLGNFKTEEQAHEAVQQFAEQVGRKEFY